MAQYTWLRRLTRPAVLEDLGLGVRLSPREHAILKGLLPAGTPVHRSELIRRAFADDLACGIPPASLYETLRTRASYVRYRLIAANAPYRLPAASVGGYWVLVETNAPLPEGYVPWRTYGTALGRIAVEKAVQIAACLDEGLPWMATARRFGVSESTVALIAQGVHWSVREGHVTRPRRHPRHPRPSDR